MTGSDLPPRASSEPLGGTEVGRLAEELGRLLQVGVVLAAILLVAGVLLVVASTPGSSPTVPLNVHPGPFGASLASSPGLLLIVAGLGVLLATPIARVLLSFQTFIRLEERDYAGVVGVVLVILVLSVVAGLLL